MATDDICATSLLVQKGLNQSLVYMTPEQVQFTRGYYFFGIALNLLCLLVWVVEKRKYERTQVRPTLFLLLSIISSISEMSCGPLNTITPYQYPCWVGVILLALLIPSAAVSLIGRHMLYSFLTRFSQAAGKLHDNINEQDSTSSTRSQSDHGQRIYHYWRKVRDVAALVIFSNREAQSEEELENLKFLSSRLGTFLITLVFALPILMGSVVIIVTDPVLMKCTNCQYSSPARAFIAISLVLCIVVGMIFWFISRKIKAHDRWGLKNEAAATFLCYCIAILGFFMASFSDDYAERPLSPYTHNFLMTIGVWLVVIEQSIVQIFIARHEQRKISKLVPRPLMKRSESNPSMNRMDELDEILLDKDLCAEFEQHLTEEFGIESLHFLRQCEQWQRTYFDVSPSTRLSRARKICKTYIQSDGLYAVNVSWRVNERIIAKVNRIEAEDCPREVFDEAVLEIHKMLLSGAVLRFRISREHSKQRTSTANSSNIVSSNIL